MKAKIYEELKEFRKKLKQLGIDVSDSPYTPGDGQAIQEPALYVYWTIGGVAGGSCWDTGDEDRHYPISGVPEPEFEELDKLLEALVPDITFLQYKRLCKDCIERGESRSNDYYGNHTDYAYKLVRLGVLYKYMKGLGWLS